MKKDNPTPKQTVFSGRSTPGFTLNRLAIGAAASLLCCSMATAALWKGADGIGGNGNWQSTHFDPVATPSASTNVNFAVDDLYTEINAEVTIINAAKAKSVNVYNGKNITLKLQGGTSLTVGTGVINVGGTGGENGNALIPATSSLRIEGPATGSAVVNATRFYLEGNATNVGTVHRNSLVLSGQNLTVNLTGSFSAVANQSSITLTDGVTVNTTPTDPTSLNDATNFYIRADLTESLSKNYLTIEDGSLYVSHIRVQGVLQLGKQGALGVSEGAPGNLLNIQVWESGKGRFEAEGNGLASNTFVQIQKSGTFAVGVSEALTGLRTEAGAFELNSHLEFASDSFLELTIFGTGENDKMTIGVDGWLENVGTGAQLVLKLDGSFVPQAGESWTLFDVTPGSAGITGNFDLSMIDGSLWDLSNFNAEGGWVVTSIPEPHVLPLVGIAAAAWLLIRRRSAAKAA